VLHDEVEFIVGLNNLVKLDDVGMSDLLQNLDLSCNHVHILLVHYFALFKYLYGHFLLGDAMNAQLYLAKGAFTKRLVDEEVTYLPDWLSNGQLFILTEDELLELILFFL